MSNSIPIKIPKLSKITKRDMDEIKRTDDRIRGSNSTQNETRNAGICISCGKPMIVPANQMDGLKHKECEQSTQNDWAERFDKHYGDYGEDDFGSCSVECELRMENIKKFIAKELADARKDERMKAEVEMGLKNFKVTMEEISKARKEGYEEGVMAMAQDCEERNKGMFRGLSEGVYIKTGKELLATTNKSDHIVPPDKMVDTQNDTKKEDVLLQVANMDRIVREKWFIDWLKNHDKAILADARKEVGNGIEKMYLSVADKDPRYDTVEEIQAYNQAIYEILATLKEEGK